MGIFALLALASVAYADSCNNIPSSEQQAILTAHNTLRSSISAGTYKTPGGTLPAATTPIPALTWNCSLAQAAQAWSNGCVFKHSGTSGVGENIYEQSASYTLTTAGSGLAASNSWQKEFQTTSWNSAGVFFSGTAGRGHATQMAWADSLTVGCGETVCKNGKEVIVVCQYYPAGNYLDENIYPAVGAKSTNNGGTGTGTGTGKGGASDPNNGKWVSDGKGGWSYYWSSS